MIQAEGDPMSNPDSVAKPYLIDCVQYANWSEKIFRQMREGGVDAVNVTIAYHEDFREMVRNIADWNLLFQRYSDLIMQGYTGDDVRRARETERTAIFFSLQTPAPIEADIGLVEVVHRLGARFMQLSYNNQSLLATGCYEADDPGLTRMGRQVVTEMNRIGLVVDMSHSSDRSTFDAIKHSQRPIAITHANPANWHPARRNKSDDMLRALAESGGMLGFSFYPHHLKDGSNCTLQSFCDMVARTADMMGVDQIGIGSDLCQDQPDSIVEWMRVGRWTREIDYGEGSADAAGFPEQPAWFTDNRSLPGLVDGLRKAGFSGEDTGKIMGNNWLRFFDENFGPKT
jgi:membrane dipeptidase